MIDAAGTFPHAGTHRPAQSLRRRARGLRAASRAAARVRRHHRAKPRRRRPREHGGHRRRQGRQDPGAAPVHRGRGLLPPKGHAARRRHPAADHGGRSPEDGARPRRRGRRPHQDVGRRHPRRPARVDLRLERRQGADPEDQPRDSYRPGPGGGASRPARGRPHLQRGGRPATGRGGRTAVRAYRARRARGRGVRALGEASGALLRTRPRQGAGFLVHGRTPGGPGRSDPPARLGAGTDRPDEGAGDAGGHAGEPAGRATPQGLRAHAAFSPGRCRRRE